MNAEYDGSVLRTAARLALMAGAAALVLGSVHALTRDRLLAQKRATERAALTVVLPAALHDNDLLDDVIHVRAAHWLGTETALRVWRARSDGRFVGLVLETVAPDGYAGPIRLLVGVDATGRVLGARVLEHRETPGLGDAIETERSAWIETFRGRDLSHPATRRWRLRREGGDFDQFAGATITPRAVVAAIRRCLQYVERHGGELHAAAPGTELVHTDGPDP